MNFVPHIPAPFTVVDLLIKLAVMALLAGFVARFSMFRRLLLIEQRGPREKIQFAAFLGLPFMVGVLARLLAGYKTTDLSLEVTVLAGLLGGTIVGLAVALLSTFRFWRLPYGQPRCHYSRLLPTAFPPGWFRITVPSFWLPSWPLVMRWRRARRAGSVPTKRKSGNSRPLLI